jgi:hypothetical protein
MDWTAQISCVCNSWVVSFAKARRERNDKAALINTLLAAVFRDRSVQVGQIQY